MYKFAIVVPAYKPSNMLPNMILNILEIDKVSEVICVNDGSGSEFDSTFDEVKEIEGCKVLVHDVNKGKGQALRTAFDYCKSLDDIAAVVTVDADGQHTVESIKRVINAYTDESGLILGSREMNESITGEKIPWKSQIGNAITRFVFKYLCRLPIRDTQTGLRLYPISILEQMLTVEGDKYEYETNVLLFCKRHGIDIEEVTIETVYEDNNTCSHFRPFMDSVLIYKVIFKYILSSMLSVVVDYVVFFILSLFLKNVFLMTAISRLFSSGLNFSVNRTMVFKSKDNIAKQAMEYIVLVIFSGTVSATLISLINRFTSINVMILKLVVESCIFFFNYYVQKCFIFKKK